LIVSELQKLLATTAARLSQESDWVKSQGEDSAALECFLRDGAEASSLRARALLFLLTRVYGEDAHGIEIKLGRLAEQCALFLHLYGDGPVRILRAPARINVLGEHVDYVSYLPTASLPFGSRQHDMVMLCRPSETGQVRGASTLDAYPHFNFELKDGPEETVDGADLETRWLSYLYGKQPPAPHWGMYVEGAAYFARLKYCGRARLGFDFVVDSSIPPSGGASSSSALTVLAGAAIRRANGIEFDRAELAIDSARAEWYIGTRGGAMDHTTICMARRAHAVLISYARGRVRPVPLPGEVFRWVTFFSHPADKGQEVMLEYNERAAVSRLLIPAIINEWEHSRPELYQQWRTSLEALESLTEADLYALQGLLAELPATITLNEVRTDYPEVYEECTRAFPALIKERAGHSLQIRKRAQHHLGEMRRVAVAERVLDATARDIIDGERVETAPLMRFIGSLLSESHESLRDLYDVSTPEVERLLEIIISDPQVYGARLMGGGFGGNVLALTTKAQAPLLIERVRAEFYATQDSGGMRKEAIMVSTPGEGLSELSVESVWREVIEHFSAAGWESRSHLASFCSLLDNIFIQPPDIAVWPVIVAAGKGSRARESGLDVPKPLAQVAGLPAIKRVLLTIKSINARIRPPIVIVSPETEAGVREALAGEEVIYVLQREAHGTGDAVLCAYEQMREFDGLALVMWGTQAVVRRQTLDRTLQLARLFEDHEMVLPTAFKERPYAPLLRDHHGKVMASRETHLEKARGLRFGETNLGVFVLRNRTMFETLQALHREFWNQARRAYERPAEELGFPNELINRLALQGRGVLASPIADSREAQGIKEFADIALCERSIYELEQGAA
jgi:galactokinase/CTP:molybdopterin cytidylyltransferase MocA